MNEIVVPALGVLAALLGVIAAWLKLREPKKTRQPENRSVEEFRQRLRSDPQQFGFSNRADLVAAGAVGGLAAVGVVKGAEVALDILHHHDVAAELAGGASSSAGALLDFFS